MDQLGTDEVQLILTVELGGWGEAIRLISVLWTNLLQHEFCGCGLAEDLLIAIPSMSFYMPG